MRKSPEITEFDMNWRSGKSIDSCSKLTIADPDLLALRIHHAHHSVAWFMITCHVLIKYWWSDCSDICFQYISYTCILRGLRFLVIEKYICLLGMPIHIIPRKVRIVIESCKIRCIIDSSECVIGQRAKTQMNLYRAFCTLNHVLDIIHIFGELSHIS